MARRRTTRFIRPAANTKMWFDAAIGQINVAVGTTSTLMGTLNAAALLLRPFTILRSRLLLTVGSDQFGATETNSGALGWQVVTDSATAAGVASVPTPLTQPTADFLVFQPWSFDISFGDLTGFEANQDREYVIDSKAMRKVGHDDDVAVTIQGRGGDGYNAGLEGRFLVKLH